MMKSLLNVLSGYLEVICMVAATAALWWVFGIPWGVLEFHWWQIPGGLAAALGLAFVSQIVPAVLPERFWRPAEEASIGNAQETNISDFAHAGVSGATEEVLFRGTLQTLLMPIAGPIIAVAVVNILFGLGHCRGGPSYIVIAGVCGVYMSCALIFTGSLILVATAHAAFNLVMSLGIEDIRAMRVNEGLTEPATAKQETGA